MYEICFMTGNNEKATLAQDGVPVLFTEADAWLFIEETMARENHPKFMWTRRVQNANP